VDFAERTAATLDDLWAFATAKVEALNRGAEQTGSCFIRP
jgi:hypothetical protein